MSLCLCFDILCGTFLDGTASQSATRLSNSPSDNLVALLEIDLVIVIVLMLLLMKILIDFLDC